MKLITVFCENLGKNVEMPMGSTVEDLAKELFGEQHTEYIDCYVNNELVGLGWRVFNSSTIRFATIGDRSAIHTYTRSLTFLLQKALADLYPNARLEIRNSLGDSLYFRIKELNGEYIMDVTPQMLEKLGLRMREYVYNDVPFTEYQLPTAEAIKIFEEEGYPFKALLQQTKGDFYTITYKCQDLVSIFYGPLVPSTKYLKLFELRKYHRGLLLCHPSRNNPSSCAPTPKAEKIYEVFKEYTEWNSIMEIRTIGSINRHIQNGHFPIFISICEALHERKYAEIADMLAKRKDKVRMVLIAGPSSSGKTTTSKRVAVQAKIIGFNPILLSLDDYFVDRENTPLDENGEYDFEALNALDLPFLNQQLTELFQGKEIEIPRFNFAAGKREFDGRKLKMNDKDILIVEGIHALNPELTKDIPNDKKFKIYASALTSVAIDETSRIPTTANRLIRRIVRDAQFRGTPAEETILRWDSVRRGEEKNIFPYQEEADIMFNSALPYELCVLKLLADPLLHRIKPVSEAYPVARRLLTLLSYFEYGNPKECFFGIPPTSVLREFVGGSTFNY